MRVVVALSPTGDFWGDSSSNGLSLPVKPFQHSVSTTFPVFKCPLLKYLELILLFYSIRES